MWPLILYEVPISKVEKLERLVSTYARKWPGLPKCLSSTGLYGKGILELPISSLSEEYKCAKVRLEMMLTESKDPLVAQAAPTLATGKKWNPSEAIKQPKAALRHRDFVPECSKGGVAWVLGTACQSGTRPVQQGVQRWSLRQKRGSGCDRREWRKESFPGTTGGR